MQRPASRLAMLLALAFTLVTGHGAEPADTLTLRNFFCDLAAPELDLLERGTRLDMLDYAEAGQDYTARNMMNGECRITSMTDSALYVELSQVSRAELFLLPDHKGATGGFIYTIDSDGADSQLSLYDAALHPVKTDKYFKSPGITDFLLPRFRNDKQAKATLTAEVPFTSIVLSYAPATHTLTARLSLEGIVSRESMGKLRPLLCEDGTDQPRTLQYVWNGSRFILQ